MRIALLFVLVACNRGQGPGHVAIDKADGLWGGDGFCARTGLGLACWSSSESVAVARGPRIVTGLAHVTQVAIAAGEGCALHDGDVTCFTPGEAESRGRSFDQPTQIAVVDASICVRHASGVSCWPPGGSPVPRAELHELRGATGGTEQRDRWSTCSLDGAGDVTCRVTKRP